MFHSLHPERISGFIRRDRGSQPHLRPLPAGLQQCHPDSTLGEQKSDQSHHLKIKTDSHNQRHKSYRGTCCTVTTATGHGGGRHHRLSEIGCWWCGATVQLSWLFCPLRESGLLVFSLPRPDGSCYSGMMGKTADLTTWSLTRNMHYAATNGDYHVTPFFIHLYLSSCFTISTLSLKYLSKGDVKMLPDDGQIKYLNFSTLASGCCSWMHYGHVWDTQSVSQ